MPVSLLHPIIQAPKSHERQRHASTRTITLPYLQSHLLGNQSPLLALSLSLFVSQIFKPFHQARLQLLLLRPLARLPLHPTAGQHHRRDDLQLWRLLWFRIALRSNTHSGQELEVNFIAVCPLASRALVMRNVGNDGEISRCRWVKGR